MSYWVAGATVVGAVVNAKTSSSAASKTRNAATNASDATLAESARQFDLVRGDTAGQRFIGNSATNALAKLYGYGPVPASYGSNPTAGATPYDPQPIATSIPGGKFNIGGNLLASNSTLSKIHDPFASRHGDENRNLKAFAAESGVMQLPNGQLILPDGSTFSESQLKDVAGTWYGAVHAPDGNQADWQQRYTTLVGGLPKTATGNAPGSQTSDGGVPNSAPLTATRGADGTYSVPNGGATGTPDMSVFFKSPDYQFNLDEGQKAIDRSAAARGGLLSGGAVKEGERYASGMASREYSSFVDRLMQQAGLGTTGIGASAAAGANYAGINANVRANTANTVGSAYTQQAQGINNSIQGGISDLLLARYLGNTQAVKPGV